MRNPVKHYFTDKDGEWESIDARVEMALWCGAVAVLTGSLYGLWRLACWAVGAG